MKYLVASSVLIGVLATASAISFFDVVKEEWHAFKVRINLLKNILVFFYQIRFMKKKNNEFWLFNYAHEQ